MPDSVSEERRKLVKHYGAEVKLIHDAGNIGKCIDECMQTALAMAAADPKVYVPQQFANEANTWAHREQTGREILEQAGIPIHGFCSGIGTGGTITGVGQALRAANPDMEVWAAEPEHAAILSGGAVGTHIQMGIGDGVIPDILDRKIYNRIEIVTDEEAIETARELASRERPYVRHLQRHQCGGGPPDGPGAREREDGGDDPGRHGGTVFFHRIV